MSTWNLRLFPYDFLISFFLLFYPLSCIRRTNRKSYFLFLFTKSLLTWLRSQVLRLASYCSLTDYLSRLVQFDRLLVAVFLDEAKERRDEEVWQWQRGWWRSVKLRGKLGLGETLWKKGPSWEESEVQRTFQESKRIISITFCCNCSVRWRGNCEPVTWCIALSQLSPSYPSCPPCSPHQFHSSLLIINLINLVKMPGSVASEEFEGDEVHTSPNPAYHV